MAATSSGGGNGMRSNPGAVTSQPSSGGNNGANNPGAGQKVFVQRDYSLGTGVRFQTRFPPELEGKIDRQLFEDTIGEINTVFAEAEQLSCASYITGCLACLTAYMLLCCFESHYEKSLKKVSRTIYRRNERDWIPRGLLIGEPVERGLRVIEITILNSNSKAVGT